MPKFPTLTELLGPFFGLNMEPGNMLPLPDNDPMVQTPGTQFENPFIDPERWGPPDTQGGGRIPQLAIPKGLFRPGPVPEPYDPIDRPPEFLPPGPGMDNPFGPGTDYAPSWEPAAFKPNEPKTPFSNVITPGAPSNPYFDYDIQQPYDALQGRNLKNEDMIEPGKRVPGGGKAPAFNIPPQTPEKYGPEFDPKSEQKPNTFGPKYPITPVSVNPEQDAVQQFIGNVFGAESGGNPRAKNPRSTALGLGQYLKSTWLGMMRRHPELGLTVNGRTDRAQNKRAIQASANDYIGALKRHGLPVTAGYLYGAHFLGEAGVGVLRNPDSTPMTKLLTRDVLIANPFLYNMTVGETKAWLNRKMGAKGGAGAKAAGAAASAATQGSAAELYIPKLIGGVAKGSGGATAEAAAGTQERRPQAPTASVSAGGQEQASAEPTPQPDAASPFVPYLQQIAQRRQAYRQRRADRRSRLEELLQLGDRRQTRA